MFLEALKRKNPKLIETAKYLHRSGQILPDTYILDLDTIIENAALLKKTAEVAGIELFYMTKQFGRNPLVANHIRSAGIEKAVAVDYREILALMAHKLPLGNVGHLVQVPQSILESVLQYGVDFITVYSTHKLQEINRICANLGIRQKILFKVQEADDETFEGQYGGFCLAELDALAKVAKGLPYVQPAGLTSFPCFLFDGSHSFKPSQNINTLKRAKAIFEENGIYLDEINLPGATCCDTIPMIAELGGTQGEPGHALTGTTPLHAVKEDIPEKPAMVYASEISHNVGGSAYFYGGGYYRRGHFSNALVDNGKSEKECLIKPFSPENIDYYLEIESNHEIGATVIAAFRAQIFVSRSDVAVVSGIGSGKPKIEGIFDSQGRS